MKRIISFFLAVVLAVACTVAFADAWQCPACNHEGNSGKFCVKCGEPMPGLDTGNLKTNTEIIADQEALIAQQEATIAELTAQVESLQAEIDGLNLQLTQLTQWPCPVCGSYNPNEDKTECKNCGIWFCTACGNDTVQNADTRFCGECGSVKGSWKCAQCGTVMIPDTFFCSECAAQRPAN